MRLHAAMLAAIAVTSPAAAQTFDEAVRANFGLGVQLCLGGGNDLEAWASTFRAAEFSERVERSSSNSDTTHYFTAPAETVTVELYYGEMPEYCSVATQHMGVTDASAVLDAVVPVVHPGYLRKEAQGGPNPQTGRPATCVSYEDPTNPIGHIVGIAPGGEAQGCVANGTSQFYSSYRV